MGGVRWIVESAVGQPARFVDGDFDHAVAWGDEVAHGLTLEHFRPAIVSQAGPAARLQHELRAHGVDESR